MSGRNASNAAPVTAELLASRVAFACAVATGVVGLFWVFRTVMAVVTGETHHLSEPSYFLHAVAIGFFAVGWALSRRSGLGIEGLRRVEAGSFLGGCISLVAMGYYVPLVARPELIMVLAAGIVLFGRAAYVPSTGRRTLVYGVLIGVPLFAVSFLVYERNFVPLDWQRLYPGLAELTSAQAARAVTASAAVWWALIIGVCTLASMRIYGLRREVAKIEKLGQYSLNRKLGEGGMGVVYSAQHAMLRRPTAIKLLHPEKSGDEQTARFEREVRQTARLTHPNTVTIYDYGRTPEGIFYYAMELLVGATLSEVVDLSGPMPSARVAHVLEAVAGALAEAHEAGLIHRDIKPANIMLCEQGGLQDVTKVLDFGLVKELSTAGGVALTNATTITGTPQYMPPEAIRNPESVDERSDLYSLGAVGFYLLTGRHVFEGNNVVEVCGKHLHEPPPSPSSFVDDVDPTLEEIVLACLEKDPGDRPQSARELRRRLRRASCLGEWTEERANEWWDEHARSLADLHSGLSEDASTHMLGVDLRGRARSASLTRR